MSVQLTPSEFQRLVYILQEQAEFITQSDRLSLVTLTFGNSGKGNVIRSRLSLSGTPMSAAVELVNFLCKFGQVSPGTESLGMLLDQLLMNMGISAEADFLAQLVETHKLNQPPSPPFVAPARINPAPLPMPNTDGKYIFISYARTQQAYAQAVSDALKAVGFRVFFDLDILKGDNWDMSIEMALGEVSHLVLLLSPASMPYRKEVYREWFYFDQQGKPIIPLYVEACVLHSRLLSYNYIDARSDFAHALDVLVKTLLT